MATSSGSNPGNDEDIGNAASILKDQFSYLEENLHIDNTLASKLYGWKPSLLRSQEYKRIGALLDQGEDDKAFEKWYTFATGYSEELLKEFCKCLRKAGKDARPKLIRIADKIEAAMENYRSSRSAGTEENKIMAGSNPGRKRSAEQSIGSAKRTQPGKWSLADRCLFMSHSSQDKDTVDEIVQALRQSGINVWYDKDEIRTGHQWDKKISEVMPHMYGFICCMSEEFFDSDICYEELQAFRSARKDNSAIPKDSIFPVIVVKPSLFKGVRASWRMALPTQTHYKRWTDENDQQLFLKDMKDFVNGSTPTPSTSPPGPQPTTGSTQAGSDNPPGPSTSGLAAMSEDPENKPSKGDDLPVETSSQEPKGGPSKVDTSVLESSTQEPKSSPSWLDPSHEEEMKRHEEEMKRLWKSSSPEPTSGPLMLDTSDEEDLEKLCWIPFGIQTLSVGEEGGMFLLEPEAKQFTRKDQIMLTIPKNAVNMDKCEKLTIRYAVLIHGPFVLDEGYRLTSPVVYMNFNPEHILQTSPLSLQLPHWANGEKGYIAVAPHSVNEKRQYKFELHKVEESFSERFTVTISGHSSLYCSAFDAEYNNMYMLLPVHGLSLEMLRVYVVYRSATWSQIIQKMIPYDFGNVGHIPFTRGYTHVKANLPPDIDEKGLAICNGPEKIYFENVDFKTMCKKPRDLECSVRNESYPQSFLYEAVKGLGHQRIINVQFEIAGKNEHVQSGTKVKYPLKVYSKLQGDGEACANEVELQKDWGTSARQGELIVEKRKWDAVSECVIQAKYSRTSHAFLKGHSR